MSPLRWDVLAVSLLLAFPVLMLGLRGDFSVEDMTARLPWCLAAGWGAVALLRFAGRPRSKPGTPAPDETGEADSSPTS